jgi:hypothetical protein
MKWHLIGTSCIHLETKESETGGRVKTKLTKPKEKQNRKKDTNQEQKRNIIEEETK